MNNEEKNIGNTEIAHLNDTIALSKIMVNENRGLPKYDFISAAEISVFLGIGKTQAYEICKKINAALSSEGYLTFRGKIPRSKLMEYLPR